MVVVRFQSSKTLLWQHLADKKTSRLNIVELNFLVKNAKLSLIWGNRTHSVTWKMGDRSRCWGIIWYWDLKLEHQFASENVSWGQKYFALLLCQAKCVLKKLRHFFSFYVLKLRFKIRLKSLDVFILYTGSHWVWQTLCMICNFPVKFFSQLLLSSCYFCILR